MIKIYSNQNSTIVYHLKNVLENCEIQCEIRNESLSRVLGPYPPTESWIELWILDDARHDEASKIIAKAVTNDEPTGKPWKCPKCGEESESQFTECWNCGESRL